MDIGYFDGVKLWDFIKLQTSFFHFVLLLNFLHSPTFKIKIQKQNCGTASFHWLFSKQQFKRLLKTN